MKYEKYVALIKRLEDYAAKNPKSYQYRVAALAALGYAYIVGLILLCILLPLLLLGALIVAPAIVLRILLDLLKLWFIVLPGVAVFFSFLSGAIRSLTAKVPAPEGNEIERKDAPQLFEFVEKTCGELEAQKPEKVLINDAFNASVVTIPRYGIFGRRVYLNLGLPLMYALSPEQFRAVLTHEIGHISGKHGAFSKWAYQLHETWRRFIESQELEQYKLSALYEKFVNWFFPYFSAYSFVLMRRHERDADADAARLVGAQFLGEALINLEVKGAMLSQDFWQKIFEENTREEKPPTELFSRMALTFRRHDAASETRDLRRFVEIKTDYGDTHPSLADRLKTIGYWTAGDLPKLPEPNEANAAETFLGDLPAKYAAQFDREWREKISKNWKTNFDYLQNAQKRLAELEAKETLTVEETFEMAGLVAERRGNAEAVPIVRRVLEMQPEHAEASYVLGAMLLQTDDESGLQHLNRAMHLDRRWQFAASEVAFNYLRLKGRHDEAKPYVELMENQQEIVRQAEIERSVVNPTDDFEPHKFTDEILEKVVKKISYNEEIEAAFLVAKTLRHFPEIPLHVLYLTMKKKMPKGISAQDVVNALGKQLNEFGIQYLYTFGNKDAQYENKIAAIEKSKVYQA